MSYGNRDYPQRPQPRFREVPPRERQYPPQQYDGQPQQYQPQDRQPASGSNGNGNGGDFQRAGYLRLSRSGNAVTFTLQGQRYTVAVSSLEKVLRGESEFCTISRYSNGGGK